MNAELKQCRLHYGQLSPHTKERPTAQFLLKAIEIAEHYETILLELAASAQAFRDQVTTEGIELHRLDAALARVAKPEGK